MVERALLIVIACVMVLFPLGASVPGLAAAAGGMGLVAWNMRPVRGHGGAKAQRA